MQAMRSLIVISILIAGISFYFQDVIGPSANRSFGQLLLSMKQKSPELEIPEGTFYDGLPQTNIYVEKKDVETGKLYGVIIYRQTGSYEDQAVILADSAMLQSTAEKKHLLLTLWDGEWFENMKQQEMGNMAEVPYRRETFTYKTIVLDFDGEFNLADASGISASAKAKSTAQIIEDLDSIRAHNDSVGHVFYREAKTFAMADPRLTPDDSVKLKAAVKKTLPNVDSLYAKMSVDVRREVVKNATRQAQNVASELNFKAEVAKQNSRQERLHEIEAIGKFTLALSCIIFFFIGAPLGAIIRKGGLGVPVIISVIVFIIYYIFDASGMRMARDDNWTVWFGKGIPVFVLVPLAVFFTYQANRDSTVFNIDAYRLLLMRMLGLRMKRNIVRKEVVIEDPKYFVDAQMLRTVNDDIAIYSETNKLLRWPSPIKVFFHPGDDHEIEHINDVLEMAIEDLGYTRDKHILHELNNYPILMTHAHTRPFERRWMNIVAGLILPLGIFFYIRMLRFRLRLYRDLREISATSEKIIPLAMELAGKQQDTTAEQAYKDYIQLNIKDGNIQTEHHS